MYAFLCLAPNSRFMFSCGQMCAKICVERSFQHCIDTIAVHVITLDYLFSLLFLKNACCYRISTQFVGLDQKSISQTRSLRPVEIVEMGNNGTRKGGNQHGPANDEMNLHSESYSMIFMKYANVRPGFEPRLQGASEALESVVSPPQQPSLVTIPVEVRNVILTHLLTANSPLRTVKDAEESSNHFHPARTVLNNSIML